MKDHSIDSRRAYPLHPLLSIVPQRANRSPSLASAARRTASGFGSRWDDALWLVPGYSFTSGSAAMTVITTMKMAA
jgi:hypothetical protein